MDLISVQDYEKAKLITEIFKFQEESPQPLLNPNFNILKESTEKYIFLLKKGVISDDDFKEQIFIYAIEAVYGNFVWDWIKSNLNHNKNK